MSKNDSQNPMRCMATAIDWARTNIRPIAPPNSGPKKSYKLKSEYNKLWAFFFVISN
jgi:hypothetical protein